MAFRNLTSKFEGMRVTKRPRPAAGSGGLAAGVGDDGRLLQSTGADSAEVRVGIARWHCMHTGGCHADAPAHARGAAAGMGRHRGGHSAQHRRHQGETCARAPCRLPHVCAAVHTHVRTVPKLDNLHGLRLRVSFSDENLVRGRGRCVCGRCVGGACVVSGACPCSAPGSACAHHRRSRSATLRS